MRRCVAAIVIGILLSLNPGGRIALADDVSFRFTNNTPETIYLNLHSKARTWSWPGGKKRWILNAGQKGTVAAGACEPNEDVCYGGGNKDGSRYWGVSLDGKKGCANCCIHCGKSHGWNLSEHADPPSRPHTGTVDDGPALVPADD
jgi:hypothetical protein